MFSWLSTGSVLKKKYNGLLDTMSSDNSLKNNNNNKKKSNVPYLP